MKDEYLIKPVGIVRAGRALAEDDDWDAVAASIALDESQFGPEALMGLEAFSHVEVLYVFHAAEGPEETGARHPRGRKDWPKTGIFAQRAKDRPNHIGATICRILSVHGTVLTVSGLDAIDGTPVIDIKPVMSAFLPRGDFTEPAWATELMRQYWRR